MVYCHYVLMGGFAVEVDDIHNLLTRVTITVDGVLYLAKYGHFCRVKRSLIADKSKADILAKGLVCIQVLWVAGQAVERKLAGYPITLLEIHTLVHVVCALVMYGLWAQKPLNVQDPTIIGFPDHPNPLAFMLERSRSCGWVKYRGYRGFESKIVDPGRKPKQNDASGLDVNAKEYFFEAEWAFLPTIEPQCVHIDTNPGLPDILIDSVILNERQSPAKISTYYYMSSKDGEGVDHQHPMGWPVWLYTPVSTDPVICTLYTGQALSFPGHSCKIGPQLASCDIENLQSIQHQNKSIGLSRGISAIAMTRKDLKRFSLISGWASKLNSGLGDSTTRNKALFDDENMLQVTFPEGSRFGKFPSSDCLSIQANNWIGESQGDGDLYIYPALTLLPLAYGCVHFGALGFIFPTQTEKLFWKISCIILIAVAGGLGLLILILYIFTVVRKYCESYLDAHRQSHRDVESAIHTSRTYDNPLKLISHMASSVVDAVLCGHDGYDLADFLMTTGQVLWYLVLGVGYVLLGFVGVAYCVARIFLIVESFISLRHVPIGVYQTPTGNFMSYIPHL
jgi:hypothetical protein